MKRNILKFWPILTLLLLSGLIIWPTLLPGYFSHHDDLQVLRILEMRKCFEDLQLPCRWVPDMGFGNGFPEYNFYSVLPYYIGGLLSYFLSYIDAAKMLFLIALLGGGLSMYLLARLMFDRRVGLAVAVVYMLAPYRAMDSYVRGAIAESFALAVVPLVFWGFLRLIKKPNKQNMVIAAFCFGLFLLCHNLMTMLFTPLIMVWIGYNLYMHKTNFRYPVMSFLLGISTAAFFLIPAFFEQSLVQTDTLTRLGGDFRAHYVCLNQFFSTYWDYGSSVWGCNDTISFQLGLPHYILSVLAILFFAIMKFRDRLKMLLLAIFTISLIGSLFMMHNQSILIWKLLPPLSFLQFPWRFLSISIFSMAIIIGLGISAINNFKIQVGVIGMVIFSVVVLNWQFFIPQHFYPNLTDQYKLNGEDFLIQQQAGILDYLPKTASEPKGVRPDKPEVITGVAEVANFIDRSNRFEFDLKVTDRANIEVPIFDFPNWNVYVNNLYTSHSHQNYLGRIRLDLDPGVYHISGRFTDTWLRILANTISLVSIGGLIVLYFNRKIKIKI